MLLVKSFNQDAIEFALYVYLQNANLKLHTSLLKTRKKHIHQYFRTSYFGYKRTREEFVSRSCHYLNNYKMHNIILT